MSASLLSYIRTWECVNIHPLSWILHVPTTPLILSSRLMPGLIRTAIHLIGNNKLQSTYITRLQDFCPFKIRVNAVWNVVLWPPSLPGSSRVVILRVPWNLRTTVTETGRHGCAHRCSSVLGSGTASATAFSCGSASGADVEAKNKGETGGKTMQIIFSAH